MPKVTNYSPEERQQRRHNPLADEYDPVEPFKSKAPKRRKSRHDEGDEERFVDTAASRKILRIGQDLEDEEAAERKERYVQEENVAFKFESRFPAEEEEQADDGAYDDDEAWGDEEEVVEEVEIDPNDLDLFNKFNPTAEPDLHWPGDERKESGTGGGTNLADLILSKIAAHEAMQGANAADEEEEQSDEIPPKVLQVYTTIGPLLSRMTTGKPPKPFTILPTLPLPTQITLLSLTEPLKWTPHAAYTATKLFISGTPASAQMFLTEALLPIIRERIEDHPQHKLHQTLYRALKKALYKPAAFFKGLLFPLLESMPTMREAHIVASVLARVSIPVLHSAAALLRLTEIAAESPLGTWNTKGGDAGGAGPVNWCIKILIEKRYALPYRVIDALVFHFLRYRGTVGDEDDVNMGDAKSVAGTSRKQLTREESLPLLWHQSLLAFAQRYRDDITEDQREALLDLLLVKGHRAIGPEVRRELLAGRGRGNVAEGGPAVDNGGDDTMEGVQISA